MTDATRLPDDPADLRREVAARLHAGPQQGLTVVSMELEAALAGLVAPADAIRNALDHVREAFGELGALVEELRDEPPVVS